MRTFTKELRETSKLLTITCDKCKRALALEGDDYPETAEIYCYTQDGLSPDQTAKGHERYVWFDICRPCFFSWLVPLFAREGVTEASDCEVTPTGARVDEVKGLA